MNRFRMMLSNMMRGRYGTDNLNKAMCTLSLVLIVINLFANQRIIHTAIVLLLILIYCRMFSRNFNKRYLENQKYLQFISKFKKSGGMGNFTQSKSKTHKILRCPGCGDKLRVPKGAGKINITCPHCNTKFIKKV
jgi:hypothetical protein